MLKRFRWITPAVLLIILMSACQPKEVCTVTVEVEALPRTSIVNAKFAENAFPPVLSDTKWHEAAWVKNDCLRCHETGVADAPMVVHRGLPDALMTAMCRSCHVLLPGATPSKRRMVSDTRFAESAFPPMMPNSKWHKNVWDAKNCMMCHKKGVLGAPVVVHEKLPANLLMASCRTCHVQVRAIMSEQP